MKLQTTNCLVHQDSRYPKAWRGERGIYLTIGKTTIRLRYLGRTIENDPAGIDTATRFNFSPPCAKWLHFFGYYAGHYRNMYHLDVWRFNFSVIPFFSGTTGDARTWFPRRKAQAGSALTPVIAILTAFTVAAVLIAQSGLLHTICARLAEVR